MESTTDISEHLPSSPKYYPFPWLSSHSWLLCLEASSPQFCLSSSLRDSLNGGTRLSSNTLTLHLHLWRKVKTKEKDSIKTIARKVQDIRICATKDCNKLV